MDTVFDINLVGKDLEHYIAKLIIHSRHRLTRVSRKGLHQLRLVCKQWKDLVKEFGSCPFCKDDFRLQITYHVSDSRHSHYGSSVETVFNGELYFNPSSISKANWRWKTSGSQSDGWSKMKAIIVLDNITTRILREQIETVWTNPNFPESSALWTGRMSPDFDSRWGISDEGHWEEMLVISKPDKKIEMEFYDEAQSKEFDRKEEKKPVKATLLQLWKTSGVKNPTKEVIPAYDQMFKLKEIIQECFCRYKDIKRKEDEDKHPKVPKPCTHDLTGLVNFNVLAIQAHEFTRTYSWQPSLLAESGITQDDTVEEETELQEQQEEEEEQEEEEDIYEEQKRVEANESRGSDDDSSWSDEYRDLESSSDSESPTKVPKLK